MAPRRPRPLLLSTLVVVATLLATPTTGAATLVTDGVDAQGAPDSPLNPPDNSLNSGPSS